MCPTYANVVEPPLRWDIFCTVVDNLGDIGVCLRLCADLAKRGHQVRLWVDDGSALRWMAPGALEGTYDRLMVLGWNQAGDTDLLGGMVIADVWVEAFGCCIPDAFIGYWAQQINSSVQSNRRPHWINLEYLSAESYVERSHGLPSPVLHGPARGWIKYFYYPGFTDKTGGLLREPLLDARRQAFSRTKWLADLGISITHEKVISLFCYEPPALKDMLAQLQIGSEPTRMLVTAGRSTAWAVACLGAGVTSKTPGPLRDEFAVLGIHPPAQPVHLNIGALHISFLPQLTQLDFDHLLWSCDLNLVRGEDSLVRALWAQVPFVWQIYEQSDMAHADKLGAFLSLTQADSNILHAHMWWNNLGHGDGDVRAKRSVADMIENTASGPWKTWVNATAGRLKEREDLATRLLQFIRKPAKMRGFAE